jgi:hypothetical protein
MDDAVIMDLITAIVAARADGDGVLTIAAVRARLVEAKLRVERDVREDLPALLASVQRRHAQEAEQAARRLCVVCQLNSASAGFDTCPDCLSKRVGTDL